MVDRLIADNNIETVINKLVEDTKYDYDEYTMLKLSEMYHSAGKDREAKKMLNKMKRLFPTGDYYNETILLLDEIKTENSKTVVMENSLESEQETGMFRAAEGKDVAVKQETGRKIPDSISEYFKDTVGLESVQVEVDKLYSKLCLQNDRKKHDFQQDIIDNYHFVIVGNRGSGKTMIGEIICKLLYAFGIHSNSDAISIRGREIAKALYFGGEDEVLQLFSKIQNRSIIIENFEEIELEFETINIRQVAICLEKIMKERCQDNSIIITGNKESIQQLSASYDDFYDAYQSDINIPLYTPEILVSIAEKLAVDKGLKLHETAKVSLMYSLEKEYRNKDFMNVISIKRSIDEASSRLSIRYRKKKEAGELVSESDMVVLIAEDFGLEEIQEETLLELMEDLNALIGLSSVKNKIKKQVETINMSNKARELKSNRKISMGSQRMLFVGNPGTGKTTVAKMIGKIYHKLGVLSNGHTVLCTRSDLVSQYLGGTAQNVQNKFKTAAGGVLFIDEAYSLVNDEHDSFGKEAMNEINALLETNLDNLVVILGGYPEEMKKLLEANAGLNSRFRETIKFDDYTVDEMVEIFKKMVNDTQIKLENDSEAALYNFIERKSKKKDFGNARGVRNVFEQVTEAFNQRLAEESKIRNLIKEDFDTIRLQDFQSGIEQEYDGYKTKDELLNALNGMIGLTSVKSTVNEIIRNIQVREQAKKQGIELSNDFGTLHLIFKGNAGTGKTTVARIIGGLYTELGVLRKNVFVEVGRKDLVGRYQGHTAEKVKKVLEDADGGILFIDEAYSLNQGENDTFGHEAIDTLVAGIENKRDRLMVIIAGYSTEIDAFLESNQGLASRFSNEVVFKDYSIDDLYKIFEYKVKEKKMLLNSGTDKQVRAMIEKKVAEEKNFGNARGIRNILEHAINKKNVRLGELIDKDSALSEKDFKTLTKEDFVY